MNSRKLYNLLLDEKAKPTKDKKLTDKFKENCEQLPYLPQCKVYDV